MVIIQTRTHVVASIPILPNREHWLCSFNIFFHILWWKPTMTELKGIKLITHEYIKYKAKGKPSVFKRYYTSYPFAKSKRKSWKPTLWRRNWSHPMISFLTKSWEWSILGNPWKMAPEFCLPWNKQHKDIQPEERRMQIRNLESIKIYWYLGCNIDITSPPVDDVTARSSHGNEIPSKRL